MTKEQIDKRSVKVYDIMTNTICPVTYQRAGRLLDKLQQQYKEAK